MREQRIGILALQETHLSEEYVHDIHKLYGRRLFVINSADPQRPTASAGVAFILNREITNTADIEVVELIPGRALLLFSTWHKSKKFSILNVYAPNDYTKHPEFWRELSSPWANNHLPKPDFMLGDFNLVEDPIDRSPPHTDPIPATDALRDARLTLDVVDAWRTDNGNDRTYTYMSARSHFSRIDRIYARRSHLTTIRDWQICQSIVPTDHKLTSIRFAPTDAPQIGSGRWTWPLGLLNDNTLLGQVEALGICLIQAMRSAKDTRTATANPQRLWEEFKQAITNIAKKYAKTSMAKLTHRLRALQAELKQTQNDPSFDDSVDLRKHAMLLE
ncbi:DNase I-like protein, partial [Gloeophyllum trabeum ATCC 11539]